MGWVAPDRCTAPANEQRRWRQVWAGENGWRQLVTSKPGLSWLGGGWLARSINPFARIGSTCLVCEQWPRASVCDPCTSEFSQAVSRCPTCAARSIVQLTQDPDRLPAHCANCLSHPPPLVRCIAALDYAYPWDDLIGRFKYQAQPAIAQVLAQQINANADCTRAIASADVIIPIPMSRAKLQTRGYNQSLLLARALRCTTPIDNHALIRREETPQQGTDSAQTNRGRSARLANMRHAFVADPSHSAALQGKHLLLVDDVMTTGATLFSAARSLQTVGAASIAALVLARTLAD